MRAPFREILATVVLFVSPFVGAQSTLKNDMDSLGDDQAIIERAKALDPENQVESVQNRTVNRLHRFELGVDFGLVGGGDNYIKSRNFGGNLDYHFAPKWSAGVRYNSYLNELTDEGRTVYDRALAQRQGGIGGAAVPSVDNPIQTVLAVVDWYPVYGKLNLFGWIPHFDLFLLGGYGKTTTELNGVSDTYAAGGGAGIWLTNLFSMRFELRYQTYSDRPNSDTRHVDSLIGQGSIGILL